MKEFVSPVKKRKTHNPKITLKELTECYKYYFLEIPVELVEAQIKVIKRITERIVYYKRNTTTKKKKYSQNELIFIDYLEGILYPELIKKYKVSQRKIQDAIHEGRKALVDGINRDIKNGFLIYEPTKKQ